VERTATSYANLRYINREGTRKSMTNLRHNLGWILAAAGLSVAATIAWSQSAPPLNAREIFYAPAPQPAEVKPAKSTQSAPKASAQKAETTKDAPAQATPGQAPSQPPAQARTPDPPVRSSPASGAVPVTLVSLTRKPLGVRLSILKTPPNGQAAEVSPDTSFQPGDRVRLSIQVSTTGYLYIINRGSSGTWTQLFPSPELPDASNAVVPGVTYAVPPDRNFVVSDPPGEEKLFVILSRTPDLDIQSLTLDLSRRGAGSSTPKSTSAEPPSQPVTQPPSRTTIAQSLPPMNDAMVDRLRNMYARDLIIEKVDEQTPGTRKENAVYAVNPGDGDDTRVVLDAPIKHL
jgi:Domain of unknown function (DUF4384)